MVKERIDNLAYYQTPEGILLTLVPVGLVLRAFAFGVDFVIRVLFAIIAIVMLSTMKNVGVGIFFLVFFLLVWFYDVAFEVFGKGQTPGKRIFGIYVCMNDGMPISWQASMIRNLLRLADFLPLAFISGILCMLFSDHGKRLGDWAAGSVVVYKDRKKVSFLSTDQAPIAPPMVLEWQEQQAILSFAERQQLLGVARAQELAQILQPLTKMQGQESSLVLLAYAAAILGVDGENTNRIGENRKEHRDGN